MTGTAEAAPVLVWIAPMMGATGAVPDVFETLAPGLAGRGYPAVCASSRPGSWARLREQVVLLEGGARRADAIFVHVYGGRSFAVADLLSGLARRRRVPLIGYLSGGSIPGLGASHPGWVRRVLSRFDLLSAPSPFMARFVQSLGLEPTVNPNPVDLDAFVYLRRVAVEPRLLWMRGFESVYNPELAIETLRLVRQELPGATLTMAGRDRGLLDSTKQAARRLGVADAVSFPGFLDRDARLAALAAHDVFLHTNRVDNTPLSLLEVAASGLAIVGCAVGGVPDLVADGREALLAADGDATGLAERVVRLVGEPGLAVSLADAARARVEPMHVQRVLDDWSGHLVALGVKPVEAAPGAARFASP